MGFARMHSLSIVHILNLNRVNCLYIGSVTSVACFCVILPEDYMSAISNTVSDVVPEKVWVRLDRRGEESVLISTAECRNTFNLGSAFKEQYLDTIGLFPLFYVSVHEKKELDSYWPATLLVDIFKWDDAPGRTPMKPFIVKAQEGTHLRQVIALK